MAIIGRKSPFRWIFDWIIEGKLILCVSNEIVVEYKEILTQKNGTEVTENIISFLSIHPFVEKHEPYYKFYLFYFRRLIRTF